MNVVLRIILLSLCMAASALAQDLKPTRESVVKLLTLMDTKENIRVALEAQTAQMKIGMRQGFLSKQPKAPEAILQRLDALLDTAMAELTVDELFEASVPVYQNNLNAEEVKAMTDFYASPAGKQILKKMPKIIADSMQAGGAVAQTKMTRIMEKMDQQMEELMKAAAEQAKSQEQK
jgi:hypothetical protein